MPAWACCCLFPGWSFALSSQLSLPFSLTSASHFQSSFVHRSFSVFLQPKQKKIKHFQTFNSSHHFPLLFFDLLLIFLHNLIQIFPPGLFFFLKKFANLFFVQDRVGQPKVDTVIPCEPGLNFNTFQTKTQNSFSLRNK